MIVFINNKPYLEKEFSSFAKGFKFGTSFGASRFGSFGSNTMTKCSIMSNGMSLKSNIEPGMSLSCMLRWHGNMWLNKSRLAASPPRLCFTDLIKLEEPGTSFVEGTNWALLGIGNGNMIASQFSLGWFPWWLGGCPWLVGWDSPWFGGVMVCPWLGFMCCYLFCGGVLRPRGPAFPLSGHVFFLGSRCIRRWSVGHLSQKKKKILKHNQSKSKCLHVQPIRCYDLLVFLLLIWGILCILF